MVDFVKLYSVSPTMWFVSKWPSCSYLSDFSAHAHLIAAQGLPSGSRQEPAAKKRGLANVLLLTRQRSEHSVRFFHYQEWHQSNTEPVLTRVLFGSE